MFVIRGDTALITFEKGPDGKVSRMLFRDIGGSVEVFTRITAAGAAHRAAEGLRFSGDAGTIEVTGVTG
jgi:hypothetical protein